MAESSGEFHLFNQENGSNDESLTPKEQERLNRTRNKGNGLRANEQGGISPLGTNIGFGGMV